MYKLTEDKQEKKQKPIWGIILFFVSILISIFTLPFGLVYGFIHSLFSGGFKKLGDYFMEMAIVIDEQGNVVMQYLLNVLWIKGANKYHFGDRGETISSVLGKNEERETLSGFGKLIVKILDTIDPRHSFNSISYLVHRENTIQDEKELNLLIERLSRNFQNVSFDDIQLKSTIA
jgi:hypothetical protein